MAKKQKKFKEWQEDEWDSYDDNDFSKRDGKRYNVKKEAVKQQRTHKSSQKNKFFEPGD